MAAENKRIRCPACNSGFLEEETSDYDTFVKDGLREIRVVVRNLSRKKCSHCKEEFLDSAALDRVQKEKYGKLDLLTPEELKTMREKLGLTQEEMSDLLGVGKKSYFRWENGLSIQNKSIDRYIRLVRTNPANILCLKEWQRATTGKDYVRERVGAYIARLRSIDQLDEELVGQVGHETEIPPELEAKVENVIKKYIEEKDDV